MKRIMLLGLFCLIGCHSISTPFEPRRSERTDDPLLSTAEQRRKARYLLALPDDELGPRSGSAERPVLSPPN